jgi:glycosyltransferase involved in cell wall biosynthesis
MKTLLFCNLIPRKTGAYEALLAAIGQEFRKAGDEFVVVFSGEPIPPVAESLRGAGVKWQVLAGWVAPSGGRVRPWNFVLPALRIIRHERPDIVAVHFGNELPTLVASLLCRVMGWWLRLISSSTTRQLDNYTTQRSPRWVWEQDQQIRDPGRMGGWISKIRLLGLGVDRFLAVYEGGRQSLLKRGVPAQKITVIHNAVAPYTPSRKKGWLREELGIDPGEVIFITNGSLIPRKRIDFLLHVCADLKKAAEKTFEQKHAKNAKGDISFSAEVRDQTPPARSSVHTLNTSRWSLLVIGDGPERERLAVLAGELGIAAQVHFLGLRNDVREILPESDIYLHAARAEACTYAVTESLAAGIPALALNAGAAREQIEDGVSGYVFEEAVTGPFTACLVDLVGDPSLRMEMGQRAQSRWESLFHVARAAHAYHAMYDNTALIEHAPQ